MVGTPWFEQIWLRTWHTGTDWLRRSITPLQVTVFHITCTPCRLINDLMQTLHLRYVPTVPTTICKFTNYTEKLYGHIHIACATRQSLDQQPECKQLGQMLRE